MKFFKTNFYLFLFIFLNFYMHSIQSEVVQPKKSQPATWQKFPELNKAVINFEAKAPHDAIILFAAETSETLAPGANVYEVIIGGWNNAQTVIRRNWQDNNTNQGLVSGAQLDANQFIKFWVLYNNGEIKIGKGDYPNGEITSYKDSNAHPDIKYVSLTTWDVPVEYRNVRIESLADVAARSIGVNYGEPIYFKIDNKYMAKGNDIDLWAYTDKKDIFMLESKDGKSGAVNNGDTVLIKGPGDAYVKADYFYNSNLIPRQREAPTFRNYWWQVRKDGNFIFFEGIDNLFLCAEGASNQNYRLKCLTKSNNPNQRFNWILEKMGSNVINALNKAQSQNDFDAILGQINVLNTVSQEIKNQFIEKIKANNSSCSISFLAKARDNGKLSLDENQKAEITNIINDRKALIEREGISYS